MVTSITRQCRQCGGTASLVPGQDHLQCDYCQSLVFTTDNPLTVDGIRSGGEFLEGAECPVCVQPLETGTIDGNPVLFCGKCFGLLIRKVHFGTVIRARRARRNPDEKEPVGPIDQTQYQRRIDCPSCLLKMEVHPYYGPGNVVIDSCHRCEYIWLDHSELRSIERAEGGREPALKPFHVNEDGELTTVAPAPRTVPDRSFATPSVSHESPELESLLELIFGY